MKRLTLVLLSITTLAAGGQPTGDESGERTVLYWYDPMRPDVHFDSPGKSPFMDMQLVAKYAGTAGAEGVVSVDPRMLQTLGVRTAQVRRGTFWQRIDAAGRIAVDEEGISAVSARADGWVERLHVRSEFTFVERGTLVAEIRAPELELAQREFMLAHTAGVPELIAGARDKLSVLGIDKQQLAALERGQAGDLRLHLRAPHAGYVTGLAVREGSPVRRDVALFEIADHDPIWVLAEIPEVQSTWISPGQAAEVRLAARPGSTFKGIVDHVYPVIDATTRTRTARILLPNPDEPLHPGMYADVTLFGGARHDVLLVPSEAVIRTGVRDIVVRAEGDGRFRPVQIQVGGERNDQTVVTRGLRAGERVVTSGQFLIDSEANLRGAYQRMGAEEAALPMDAHGMPWPRDPGVDADMPGPAHGGGRAQP